MKLTPTMSGSLGTIELANVLQMFESSRVNGTVYAGAHYLRLRSGRIVKTSISPANTIARMQLAESFSVRIVPGKPSGDLDLGVTAVLMEAARIADEARSLNHATQDAAMTNQENAK